MYVNFSSNICWLLISNGLFMPLWVLTFFRKLTSTNRDRPLSSPTNLCNVSVSKAMVRITNHIKVLIQLTVAVRLVLLQFISTSSLIPPLFKHSEEIGDNAAKFSFYIDTGICPASIFYFNKMDFEIANP